MPNLSLQNSATDLYWDRPFRNRAMMLAEMMSPKEVTDHRAFHDHEYAVAARFPEALAAEPGLTCKEWERRNPFVMPTTPAGALQSQAA